MKYDTFEFSKFEFHNFILKLFYKIDNLEFIEEINFNSSNLKLRTLNESEMEALNLAFTYIHLIAGISYYKALLPKNIQINTIDLNKEQKYFFDFVYLNGLGEFSFKNNLNLKDKINFPYSLNAKNSAKNINLKDSILLPIGGGKDSIVSLEILKTIPNQKIYTFSVNTALPIKNCCEIANCENILITRKISPLLIEINNNIEKYNSYNGHVPITAIITFISVATSILYNCNTVVISSERSANVGNTNFHGLNINHQWSKSFEAEVLLHDFISKYIVKDFNYFSMLRPLSEIYIAKLFTKISKFDNVFSSCNKNFKIVPTEKPKRWCCDCDKCRFVFLMLAPFMQKDKLIEIFGDNLLNNENNSIGYQELVGLSGSKPFECVGELEESILAFCMLENTGFKEDFIVKEISMQIDKLEKEKLFSKYFSINIKESLLNEKFLKYFLKFVN